jgi:uncharacterized SAM-binding protein YcdF (DUF218 family)
MFELGKIAWLLLAPANLLLLVLLVVFLALPRRRAPRAKGWLGVVVLAMVLIACTPLSRLPLTVLENRFTGQALPQKVDGVIVLGGGITPAVSLARNEPAVAAATPRLLAFADLARRLPSCRWLSSGWMSAGSCSRTRRAIPMRMRASAANWCSPSRARCGCW